jgi:hypothetical protein
MKAMQVKVELKKQDAKESVGLAWLRKVLSGEFCEHGNKPTVLFILFHFFVLYLTAQSQ